uniref:Uncharacterized protein n=1 Tax=Lygus hesperus TaxID=30085 RepID=A0A146M7V5_LYGHE
MHPLHTISSTPHVCVLVRISSTPHRSVSYFFFVISSALSAASYAPRTPPPVATTLFAFSTVFGAPVSPSSLVGSVQLYSTVSRHESTKQLPVCVLGLSLPLHSPLLLCCHCDGTYNAPPHNHLPSSAFTAYRRRFQPSSVCTWPVSTFALSITAVLSL